MEEVVLQANHISKQYDANRVLEDISFRVKRGEVIVISGITAETYMMENYPNITLQKYDTYANAKNALENGNGAAWINNEIATLGEENFFHAAYEATLLDTYGAEYEDTLVIEGGQVQ